MTIDELIAQARELSKEATPGDWSYETCYGVATVTAQGHDDVAHAVEYLNFRNAEFVVFARNNIERLCDEIESLEVRLACRRQERDALRSENESLKNGIAPTLEMLSQALAERDTTRAENISLRRVIAGLRVIKDLVQQTPNGGYCAISCDMVKWLKAAFDFVELPPRKEPG